MRLGFDQLNIAVEALEVFHCFLLDLNWADGGWSISLRLEPAVGDGIFLTTSFWWRNMRRDRKAWYPSFRAAREALLFFLLLKRCLKIIVQMTCSNLKSYATNFSIFVYQQKKAVEMKTNPYMIGSEYNIGIDSF